MAVDKHITMKQFNGVDYDTLYPKTIASQIDDVYSKDEMSNLFLPKAGGSMGGILDMNGNRITNLPTPISDSEPATKGYVDGSVSLVYSDWITFEHSVSNVAISSSSWYEYNIKDINGNENYESGHNFIQIQASETFNSDNRAVLDLYSVAAPTSHEGFLRDRHEEAGNTQNSRKLECFSSFLGQNYFFTISNAIYHGNFICKMRIQPVYDTSSNCSATVTGKYRYIDFKS